MVDCMFLTIIIPIIIQIYINRLSSKYRRITNEKKLSGAEVAREILKYYKIKDVFVLETRYNKYNIFTSNSGCIKFSREDFHKADLSSLAYAAMESMHVVQYYEGNKLLLFRNKFMKLIYALCYTGYFILLYALLINAYNLIFFALFLFVLVFLFHLFTYKIEKEAKDRCLEDLSKIKLIDEDERYQVKELLNAYSLNYFASIITCLAKFIKF